MLDAGDHLTLSLFDAPPPAPRAELAVGSAVGARRWVMIGTGPDPGFPPWRGIVLSKTDPLAWKGSIAFPWVPPGALPPQAAVVRHVDQLQSEGLLLDETPVLWDFGDQGTRMFWEKTAYLRSYTEDLAAWRAALAASPR